MSVNIHVGDCIEVMRSLPEQSVQCCVTSPPYWGLRDYGNDGQIGLEETPEAYVERMVEVFREARRVLKEDGTLWMNLGDSYTATTRGGHSIKFDGRDKTAHMFSPRKVDCGNLKPKDLVGIPWRVAFALQADGWWLRQDIIWHKPNPMPESVTDRCTKAHEYVFLLSKSARYFYDHEAVAEVATGKDPGNVTPHKHHGHPMAETKAGLVQIGPSITRNRRSVWSITTKPFSGAHFAVMPPNLAKLCVQAGTKEGDTVLDPFGGAGTTGLVADRLRRDAVLIELNPEYAKIAEGRILDDAPMFADVTIRRSG